MSFSLVPDAVFNHFSQIAPDELKRRGITLLLSDLDYTLAAKSTRRPGEEVRQWIDALHEAGIQLMIVSNNRSSRRVDEFCAELGVPYQGHARKPSPQGLNAAMERAGASRACTAMLGDKLLTDVLAAKRAGVPALMVEPVGGPVTMWQRVIHAMQEPFKRRCQTDLRRGG
ncbi:YqeG family HAD IIIA-type phosphatase [Oscillibacter sp. MSJ-2]|uniref:YqeG family HAD IIIA-type phosphatase n=1 Tax=Dysosmobacter acutus TaxID=2841504 RepID=A0ABS6FAV5_9FIRM|nr:YqeG family HAD IIIA-type phosphatase [Dysosmobacter acutus]MBU5627420.1 YqeG family HAD IIIA-type phosphatase [Dysosmobacter acutus]